VLLLLGGVASIYAYDAHLEQQSLEVVTLLPPREIVPEQPEPTSRPDRLRETNHNETGIPERAVPMLSVNHPESVPVFISTGPNKNKPLPETGPVRIGSQDRDFGTAGGPGSSAGGGRVVVPPAQIVPLTDQPPPPEQPKPPKVISKGVITGLAVSLPRPAYSEIAKRAGVQGAVSVQVLVDESGRVVSAKVVSGHPLLIVEAQRAALQARFSPTKLGDQPVKVSGVITYNFVLSK
jgi:protein TonB